MVVVVGRGDSIYGSDALLTGSYYYYYYYHYQVDIVGQLEDYEKVRSENVAKGEHWAKELQALKETHEGRRRDDGGSSSSSSSKFEELDHDMIMFLGMVTSAFSFVPVAPTTTLTTTTTQRISPATLTSKSKKITTMMTTMRRRRKRRMVVVVASS